VSILSNDLRLSTTISASIVDEPSAMRSSEFDILTLRPPSQSKLKTSDMYKRNSELLTGNEEEFSVVDSEFTFTIRL
jgi:hypothetical protein